MTNPVFPVTNMGQDSKHYEVDREDPAMRSEMEGGYVVSRARHTRKPRRKFKTGYTGLKPDDMKTLEDFYDLVRGGSLIFDWTDPIDNVVWQVRFTQPLRFSYTGVGIAKLFDVMVELEQA